MMTSSGVELQFEKGPFWYSLYFIEFGSYDVYNWASDRSRLGQQLKS